MNYTKGKWELKQAGNKHYLIYNSNGLIADVYNNIEGYEANAHLIAAAPEQNQALTEIDQWLIEHPDISNDPALHIIHIHIQNALAKTEGGS